MIPNGLFNFRSVLLIYIFYTLTNGSTQPIVSIDYSRAKAEISSYCLDTNGNLLIGITNAGTGDEPANSHLLCYTLSNGNLNWQKTVKGTISEISVIQGKENYWIVRSFENEDSPNSTRIYNYSGTLLDFIPEQNIIVWDSQEVIYSEYDIGGGNFDFNATGNLYKKILGAPLQTQEPFCKMISPAINKVYADKETISIILSTVQKSRYFLNLMKCNLQCKEKYNGSISMLTEYMPDNEQRIFFIDSTNIIINETLYKVQNKEVRKTKINCISKESIIKSHYIFLTFLLDRIYFKINGSQVAYFKFDAMNDDFANLFNSFEKETNQITLPLFFYTKVRGIRFIGKINNNFNKLIVTKE